MPQMPPQVHTVRVMVCYRRYGQFQLGKTYLWQKFSTKENVHLSPTQDLLPKVNHCWQFLMTPSGKFYTKDCSNLLVCDNLSEVTSL